MKIALVGSRSFPASHGGLEVAVEKIAIELSARGHEVVVFVSSPSSKKCDGVRVEIVPAWKGKYLHTASQIIFGLRGVRRLRADVVHVHGVGPAFPLFLHSQAFGRSPVVVTAHGIDWRREKWPRIARLLFKEISSRAFRKATVRTAVSMGVAQDLEEITGSVVSFVSNGVSIPNGLPQLPEWVKPGKYSVCVARLTPEKNIEQVILDYDDATSSRLGPLVVIGGGGASYSQEYEDYLKSISSANIIFTGPLPHTMVLKLVEASGRFISLSKLEAQPIAVLEAMALGKPLYLSDIPEHRELCSASAIYTEVGRVGELKSKLLARELERNELESGSEARIIANNMTWPRSVDCYESLYFGVLNRGSAYSASGSS